MTNMLNDMMATAFLMLIIMLIVLIAIYVTLGIYLNKLNVLLYGKKTPMAWIPFANFYLLGKLTFNRIVGWILIGCMFLQSETTVTVNGVSETSAILPENVREIFSNIFSVICLLLIIYAIVKYYKLKSNTNNNVTLSNSTVVSEVKNTQSTMNSIDESKEVYNNNTPLQTNISNNQEVKVSKINSNNSITNEPIDPTLWEFVQDSQLTQNNTKSVSTSRGVEEVEIIDDSNLN